MFIFTSTNKVYGDTPNELPLVEFETRWEIAGDHPYAEGIAEDMRLDQNLHSIFGASKTAADILVQEYGMATACFRGGALTGPQHSAAELHGFLAYVMQCTMTGRPYTVFGYKGKQVRDVIHSLDLVTAFHAFFRTPRSGAVYNIGGGRMSNCSVLECIALCEDISGRELDWTYSKTNRRGDHIWWVTDNSRFANEHPSWEQQYDLRSIAEEIHERNFRRWTA